MKKLILKLVLIMILISLAKLPNYCQSLSVIDIDTTGFPVLNAKFYAFDANGKRILNLSSSDFEVNENGIQRTVNSVSCPSPMPPVPISSILTIDVSGSMKDSGIQYAKVAAKAWVQALPLGQSECAITTFNKLNYFNQDFTTNRNRLLNRIEELTTSDGTDFDAAFIDPASGGLLAAEKGRYKRVMILLTDGLSQGNENTIVQKALSINTIVFCVAIDKPCPEILRNIATKTGGLYFENIRTEEEARDVYLKILEIAQASDACEIQWNSEMACKPDLINATITLTRDGISSGVKYYMPSNGLTDLNFNPSSLRFVNCEPGIKKDTIITITALNRDFVVTNIQSSNPAFSVSPVNFSLNNGQSMQLTISFIPPDSGYVYTKFVIEDALCPKNYYASGGFSGIKPKIQTLKLIQPNGSEVFVVGSDTIITWEGIMPSEPVNIEYTTNNGTDWITIANNVRGLSYNWRIPNTPGKECLARVTAKIYNSNNDHNMVLIPAGTFKRGKTGAYKGSTGVHTELPVQNVTITNDFLLSQVEMTQELYESVMGENPSSFKGDSLPVNNITWNEAVKFCNMLSISEGLDTCYIGNITNLTCDWSANGYRLPTAAEWEYACKSGTTSDFYSGELLSTDCYPVDANLDLTGWYCGNSSLKTHNVGQKLPNGFGLYDMLGNVFELTWDLLADNYNTGGSTIDPKGPDSGYYRTCSGGSYNDPAKYCRSSERGQVSPTSRNVHLGFRLCRSY